MHLFFRNRTFRQITLNSWVSGFGDTLFYLAFINYVSAYPFAPMAILLISISETAPTVLSFFIGTLADFQKNRIRKSLGLSFAKIVLYSIVALVLLRMEFSLISVAIICLANFLSDTASSFSGSMTGPIYMRVIREDMAEAVGFAQATGNLVNIIGQFSGGILIAFISIQAMAGINVLTFIFAFVGLLFIRKNMEAFEAELTVDRTFNAKNYWKHMIDSIKQLFSMKPVINLMMTSTMDNVAIGSVISILPLILIQHPFKGLATGQSLSIYSILFMSAMIAGNFLTGRLFKNLPLKAFILISQVLAYIALLGYLLSSFEVIVFGAVSCAFVNGLMSPRVQKVFWELIPDESMGAIRSAIGVLDIVIPGLLSLAAVTLATSVNILSATVFLGIPLASSTVLTLRTKHFS